MSGPRLTFTLTAALTGYAVYTEIRRRQTVADIARAHVAIAVLDDELTATNKAIADRNGDTANIVSAIKGLDARTQVHQVWLRGLSAACRMTLYQPPAQHEPIDPQDVIKAAEAIVRECGS